MSLSQFKSLTALKTGLHDHMKKNQKKDLARLAAEHF